MTSKAIWSDIFAEVIEVMEHHMPISHSLCCRRSIGPLPSCSNVTPSGVEVRFSTVALSVVD